MFAKAGHSTIICERNSALTTFTLGAAEITTPRPTDFASFIGIVKGRSIVSFADWGNGRFELGLSGGLMLRVFSSGAAEVNIISTVNPNEIPPIIVALGDLPQQAPLHIIEEKLRGLRTLYAIFWLAQNDRINDLAAYLEKTPFGDIERDLMDSGDRLYVESLSYGSWVLAVWAKTVSTYKSISSVAGLVFERGREAYLRKLEAEAKLLENQANHEAVKVALIEFDLKKNQMTYLLDVIDKVDAPEIKALLKNRILNSVEDLVMGDLNESGARKRLEGPQKEADQKLGDHAH